MMSLIILDLNGGVNLRELLVQDSSTLFNVVQVGSTLWSESVHIGHPHRRVSLFVGFSGGCPIGWQGEKLHPFATVAGRAGWSIVDAAAVVAVRCAKGVPLGKPRLVRGGTHFQWVGAATGSELRHIAPGFNRPFILMGDSKGGANDNVGHGGWLVASDMGMRGQGDRMTRGTRREGAEGERLIAEGGRV